MIAGGLRDSIAAEEPERGRRCGFPARQAALLDGRLSCAVEDC